MKVDAEGLAAILSALVAIPERLTALERAALEVRTDLRQITGALPPTMVGVSEAAKTLGVSTPTIRRWIKQRKLPVLKIGRMVRIDTRRLHGADRRDVAALATSAVSPRRGVG